MGFTLLQGNGGAADAPIHIDVRPRVPESGQRSKRHAQRTGPVTSTPRSRKNHLTSSTAHDPRHGHHPPPPAPRHAGASRTPRSCVRSSTRAQCVKNTCQGFRKHKACGRYPASRPARTSRSFFRNQSFPSLMVWIRSCVSLISSASAIDCRTTSAGSPAPLNVLAAIRSHRALSKKRVAMSGG